MDASRKPPRCPLINTARLRPISQRLNTLTITITSKGEVTLRFRGHNRTSQAEATRGAESRLEEIRISPDGRQIQVYNRPGRSPPGEGSEPPDPPGRIYSYPDMPEKLWKRYHYAYKFVEVIRSRTAKVVLLTVEAKCKLMENSPNADFQICFYNGMALLFSKAQVTVSDSKGGLLTLDMDAASVCLHPSIFSLVEFGQECWKRCLQIEESVSSQRSDIPGHTLFPLTIRSTHKCLAVNQLTPGATCRLNEPTPTLQRSSPTRVDTPPDLDNTHPPHQHVNPDINTSHLSPCSENHKLINDMQCLSPFRVGTPRSLTVHEDNDPFSKFAFPSTCSEYSSSSKDSSMYEKALNAQPQSTSASQIDNLKLSKQDTFVSYQTHEGVIPTYRHNCSNFRNCQNSSSSFHTYKQCRPTDAENALCYSIPPLYQSSMCISSNMNYTTMNSTTFTDRTNFSAVSVPLNSFSTPQKTTAREYCPHFYSEDVAKCKKPTSTETQLNRGVLENVRKNLFSQDDPLNYNPMTMKKNEDILKEHEFEISDSEGTEFSLDKTPHVETLSIENISQCVSFYSQTSSEHAYKGSDNGIHNCVSSASRSELKYKHPDNTNNQAYLLEDRTILTTSMPDDYEQIQGNEFYLEQSITARNYLGGAHSMTNSPSRDDLHHTSKTFSYNSLEVNQDVNKLPDVIATTTPTRLTQVLDSPRKCLPTRNIANLSLPENNISSNSKNSETLENQPASSANVGLNTHFFAGTENSPFSFNAEGSREDNECSLLPLSEDPISSTCRILESTNKFYHGIPRNLPSGSPAVQPRKKDWPTLSTSSNWGGLEFPHWRQVRSSLDVSSDGRSSSPSSASDVLCQVFVPYTGWASFYASGTVWILYNDGTQLGVLSTEATVIFVDQDGSRTRYTNTDVIPAIVKMKLEKAPRVIDLLMNSSATSIG